MTQTLSQRKALAGRGRSPGLDRFDPVTAQAMQTVLALMRAGARIVHVERGRIVLRRQDSQCVVDAAGRVTWSAAR
jgi:hypothetical protein